MCKKGLCSPESLDKQSDFRAIIRHHRSVCHYISPKYFYIDAYAGPGKYYCNDHWQEIAGSPLIALEELGESDCLFFETDIDTVQSLDRYTPNVINSSILDYPLPNNISYGLAYFDPPGDMQNYLDSFAAMKQLASRYRVLDLMIYISGSSIKRANGFDKVRPEYHLSIPDLMKSVNKNYWAIREVRAKQQWTFLIGTNYIKWAEWKRKGFFNLDSPEGQKEWDKLTMKSDDFKNKYKGVSNEPIGSQIPLF